jgi:hypothetical protein
MNDRPLPASDPKGVNPRGLGPGQVRPDHNDEPVQSPAHGETGVQEEQGDRTDSIEKRRDTRTRRRPA